MLISEVVVKLVDVAVSVVDALVDVLVKVEVEAVVMTTVVVPAPPPEIGGFNGSRWKIPVIVPSSTLGCAPTAHPSVAEFR